MIKYISPFVCILLLTPVVVFGQCVVGSTNIPCSPLGDIYGGIPPGEGSDVGKVTPQGFVNTIIGFVNWFSWFIALTAVVMGLYSGWLFITARDDASQLAAARKTMLFAIIGIAVAILAFSIISITKAFIVIS